MTCSGLPRIALLALIWGSAFLWIKLADRGFSPVETITATVLAGIALVLAGVALTRRRTKPATGEPSAG
jgi:drug/metabolite transporter (DMT)-like permease